MRAGVAAIGEACLLHGTGRRLKRGREFVAALGGAICRYKLPRADVTLDLPGMAMDGLPSALNEPSSNLDPRARRRLVCLLPSNKPARQKTYTGPSRTEVSSVVACSM